MSSNSGGNQRGLKLPVQPKPVALDPYATHIRVLSGVLGMMADGAIPPTVVEHGNGRYSTEIISAWLAAMHGQHLILEYDSEYDYECEHASHARSMELVLGKCHAGFEIGLLFIDGALETRVSTLRVLAPFSHLIVCHDTGDSSYGWDDTRWSILTAVAPDLEAVRLPVVQRDQGIVGPRTTVCAGGKYLM